MDVLHTGHQFTILEPLYIRPFSYNLQNTSRTALEQPSSIVNLSLSQSQDEPIFFNWLVIVPPYSFFHSHVLLRKPSLPSSCLSIPSSFNALVTLTSVEILAWSVPGTHNASYPCILLKRIIISCIVLSSACPICSLPVILGGGITIVNGFLLLSTSA